MQNSCLSYIPERITQQHIHIYIYELAVFYLTPIRCTAGTFAQRWRAFKPCKNNGIVAVVEDLTAAPEQLRSDSLEDELQYPRTIYGSCKRDVVFRANCAEA